MVVLINRLCEDLVALLNGVVFAASEGWSHMRGLLDIFEFSNNIFKLNT